MIEVIAGEDLLVSGGSYKENGCGGLGERKTRIIVEFDRRYILGVTNFSNYLF